MRTSLRSSGIRSLVLTFAMSTLTGCHHEEASQKPVTPVGVSTVQIYESGGGVRYSASITPNTQVDLAFKSGGYIESILQVQGTDGRMRNVQAGDWVTKGTVLSQVRQTDYLSKVDQVKAQLAQLQ